MPTTNKGKNKGMTAKAWLERDRDREIAKHDALEHTVGRKTLDARWDPDCLKYVNHLIAKEEKAEARKRKSRLSLKKRLAAGKH